jgi:hypothetical protein
VENGLIGPAPVQLICRCEQLGEAVEVINVAANTEVVRKEIRNEMVRLFAYLHSLLLLMFLKT